MTVILFGRDIFQQYTQCYSLIMRVRPKIGSHCSILCSVRIHLLSVVKVCCFGLEVGNEGLDHTVACYTSTSVLLHSQSTRPCDCSHPSVPSPIRFPSPELLLGIKQWDQLPSLSGLEEDPPFPALCSSLGFALGGCRPFFQALLSAVIGSMVQSAHYSIPTALALYKATTTPWDLRSKIQDWLASQNSMHGGRRLLR